MGFFDNLGVGEPEDVRQNKKLIAQTRHKQKQLNRSLDNEENEINADINSILEEIGASLYAKYSMDPEISSIEISEFKEKIEEIEKKNGLLADVDRRRGEINQRYGEEIQMLENLLPKENFQPQNCNNQPVNSNTPSYIQGDMNMQEVYAGTCQNCGADTRVGDFFCTKCGTKIA